MKTNLPASIQKIVTQLSKAQNVDNELVAEIISTIKLTEEELSAYIYFQHPKNESYGRRLIVDKGNFKILLMSWAVGDFTAIHNHGYTEWGGVYFFGEATHRLYETTDNELIITQKDNFHKGQFVPVCGNLTHLMGNSGTENFTTLHIYGSNIRQKDISENAKVYLPEFNKTVTTMGSAYLNMDKSLVLSEIPLLHVSEAVFTDYINLVRPFYERNNLSL